VQNRIQHPTDHDDLLNKMLKGKDPKTGARMAVLRAEPHAKCLTPGQGLTPENIRYQLVTFLIAGKYPHLRTGDGPDPTLS
jgi:cytochrome P450